MPMPRLERERQQSTQTTPESTEEDYARERRTADTLTAWANNPSTDMDWATDPLLFLRAEMPPYVVEASNCEAWITELMKASTAAETGAPVEFLLDCLADPKKPHLWCAVGVNGLRPAAFYGGEGLKAAQMVDKELADLVRRRLSEVGSADTAGIRDMMPPP